jgi:serine phosphatase RsbU (regulator of sigma subunit)
MRIGCFDGQNEISEHSCTSPPLPPGEGKMLELDGLVEIIEQVADRPPEEIRDFVLAKTRAWMREQLDDISIVVARRKKS